MSSSEMNYVCPELYCTLTFIHAHDEFGTYCWPEWNKP